MRCAVAVVLALLSARDLARAQELTPTIIFGTVRSAAGVALPKADVWVEGTDRRAVTNDLGEYRIDDAPNGHVRVAVRHFGFHPDSKRVSLVAGDTRQVRFILDGMMDELDTVLVTAGERSSPRLQEFWDRRANGMGVFLTRDQIVKRRAYRVSDLFEAMMGVRVLDGGTVISTRTLNAGRRTTARTTANASPGACSMQYYVDGVFMTPGTFSLDELSPDMIEAVEIYRGPSEIPVRFRQRDTACGLIVIWTREPPLPVKRDPGAAG